MCAKDRAVQQSRCACRKKSWETRFQWVLPDVGDCRGEVSVALLDVGDCRGEASVALPDVGDCRGEASVALGANVAAYLGSNRVTI